MVLSTHPGKRAWAEFFDVLETIDVPPARNPCWGLGRSAVHAVRVRRDAPDELIAARAVALDVVLVTTNEADFQGYPGPSPIGHRCLHDLHGVFGASFSVVA